MTYKNISVFADFGSGAQTEGIIYPETIQERADIEKKQNQSLTGRLSTFKIANSSQREYKFKITRRATDGSNIFDFMNWARTGNKDITLVRYDQEQSIYIQDTVRIVNARAVFQELKSFQYESGNFSQEDTIILRSISSSAKQFNAPFILDHPIFGLLDQTYNVLG
jgi:hypothetical protein